MSARTGEGLDALRALCAGRTVVFLGASGVGKSSLVNALLGEDRIETGETRSRDGRGRHTTTRRELFAIPGGGFVIDTPGMRELGLWVDGGGLDATFEDVAELARACRFRDCRHETEPGCAVRDALDPGRLASYRKLRREAEAAAVREDRVASRAEARRWGRLHRDVAKDKRRRREE